MIRSSVAVLLFVCGLASVGCGGANPRANDASSVNAPSNTGPDITTGPGAGEPTDATPDTSNTGTSPDSGDNRSTGSSGPDTSSSSATPAH